MERKKVLICAISCVLFLITAYSSADHILLDQKSIFQLQGGWAGNRNVTSDEALGASSLAAARLEIYESTENAGIVGQFTFEKLDKKGRTKGNRYILLRGKIKDGYLIGYRQGREWIKMGLNKNKESFLLEGEYDLDAKNRGNISLKKIDSSVKKIPDDIKKKLEEKDKDSEDD